MLRSSRAFVATVGMIVAVFTGGTVLVRPGAAAAAGDVSCAEVELVFARGTGEQPGLGMVGRPLADELRAALPGRSVDVYAVVYDAAVNQLSAGPGATDMSRHVSSVAADCPNTEFVIGGYSQGASVTDIAIGIPLSGLSPGETIPVGLAPRVSAVVVFGNPLGLTGRTIAGSSRLYGSKAIEFCNSGDPVCGSGIDVGAHLAYATDGSAARGARYAADHVNAS